MNVVTFTGHRPQPNDDQYKIKRQLRTAFVDNSIDYKSDFFKVGGAPGFDTWVLETLLRLDVDPHRIEIIVPFDGFEKYATKNGLYNNEAINLTREARDLGCLFVEVSPGYNSLSFGQKCFKRNEILVKNSNIIFTNWNKISKGGTYNTIKLAEKAGLTIVNINNVLLLP